MYIDIDLDDFIDLIKNPHTVQETAELVAEYLDTDDLDGDIYINYNNYGILSQALLKNNDINYLINNFSDDNSELVIQSIFEYLKSNNAENIYDLDKVLSLLQNEGYISKTGLVGKKSYETSYEDIDDFNDCPSSVIWSEQDFKCDSEHLDVIKQLVITYLKGFGNTQYCAMQKKWTTDPYDYIKDQYFDGPSTFYGARAAGVLEILFNNFNRLKSDYIRYFGEIMSINNSTTLDEFKELCNNCDKNDLSNAYENLVDNTDFFDVTGITANYFG